MRRTIAMTLVLGGFIVPAATADPGVNVDPDTPAGKEYALPLDEARKEATGDSGGPAPEPGSKPKPAPLFGAGVERGKGRRGKDGKRGSGKGAERPVPRNSASVGAALDPGDGGGSPVLTGLLIALGMLGLGGAGALALRRGTRDS